MPSRLLGIHHISALTAELSGNLRFYTETLGLRLVKKTVNQDDPFSYHLFYGDERGRPGTELTFFHLPHLAPNRPGAPSISRIGLRVPSHAALTFFRERLEGDGVRVRLLTGPDGATAFFEDPEGQRFLLIVDEVCPTGRGIPWAGGPVPLEFGIVGLGPVFLTVRDLESTAAFLSSVLGFRQAGSYADPLGEGEVSVWATGEGGPGAEVHLLARPDLPRGRLGRGGVHHVAFRVATRREQEEWQNQLHEAGVPNSGLVERYYFRSIYFREPGGILFELATDGPGFLVDEPFEHLGERLALPPFLEPLRREIEERLPPVDSRGSPWRDGGRVGKATGEQHV